MRKVPDGTIDMVLADPPYGTTACKWDAVIDLQKMWEQLKRVAKPDAAILMTASQPFTSVLVTSNLKMFKYELIWEKSKASNFLQAKRQPLKAHENILIFCKSTALYYPIYDTGTAYKGEGRSKKGSKWDGVNNVPNPTFRNDNNGTRYPRSVRYFKTAEAEKTGALHPTQKPVALMEYLIKTYTVKGQVVLDFTMGSGTTGVAAVRTGRRFIGIELDAEYFKLAQSRILGEISAREQLKEVQL